MTDLIVIGAGLSGLIAAHTVAKAGHEVKIIAKGLGATHWHAGSIDVLGYYPNDAAPVARPLDAMAELKRAQPRHPYAMLGESHVADALNDFVALTQESGLQYAGAAKDGDNLWLPSPVGAARPTFLAPLAQLAGDLSRTEPMLIVGLRGLRDFYPELIAENLNKQGHRARAAFLPLDLAPGQVGAEGNQVMIGGQRRFHARLTRVFTQKLNVRPLSFIRAVPTSCNSLAIKTGYDYSYTVRAGSK